MDFPSIHSQAYIKQFWYAFDLQPLKRKFVRCSKQVTVGLLQKFIAKKLNLEAANQVRDFNNASKYKCASEDIVKTSAIGLSCLVAFARSLHSIVY